MSVTVLGIGWSFAIDQLKDLISYIGCDGNIVLEIQEGIDIKDDNNPHGWREGLKGFYDYNEKNDLYDIFIQPTAIDSFPASISYAFKIEGEWFCVLDGGANYYSGTGPGMVIEFRKYCKERNIKIILIETGLNGWLLSHGYDYKRINEEGNEIYDPENETITDYILRCLSNAKQEKEKNPRRSVSDAGTALLEVMVLLAKYFDVDYDEEKERSCGNLLGKTSKYLSKDLKGKIGIANNIRNNAIHGNGPIEKNDPYIIISVVELLLEKYENILPKKEHSLYEVTIIAPPDRVNKLDNKLESLNGWLKVIATVLYNSSEPLKNNEIKKDILIVEYTRGKNIKRLSNIISKYLNMHSEKGFSNDKERKPPYIFKKDLKNKWTVNDYGRELLESEIS